jgi:hypothetical protein
MYNLTKIDLKRGLRIPEMSESIAEIIGIHFGDGSLEDGSRAYCFTYRISYALDARRPKYVEFVKSIFSAVFGIQMKTIDTPRHCTVLYFCSKTFCKFFNEKLTVPFGRKTDLRIPAYIFARNDYLAAFLRGLFDTDGCYITQRDKGYSYNLLRYTTKHETFASDTQRAITQLGMKSYICHKGSGGYDVMIRRKPSYEYFMALVRPRKEK